MIELAEMAGGEMKEDVARGNSVCWSESQIEAVWDRAAEAEGFDADTFRYDAAGALIQRDAYGLKHRFGWQIDRIGESERALFWKNAQARMAESPEKKFFRYTKPLELNVRHFFAEDI